MALKFLSFVEASLLSAKAKQFISLERMVLNKIDLNQISHRYERKGSQFSRKKVRE